MTRARHTAPSHRTRRTPCNLAALMALGLLAGLTGPACAATKDSTAVLGNVVLRGLVSDYAKGATFATAAGGQTLTITQLVPKLILDWNRFDLANGDTIQFIQPSSTAAVLNRIYDKNPSTIAGAIKANGQVYLVNQNGILFNRGTQIDTNSFFASTLNITDEAFKAGVTGGGNFTPAFTGRYDADGATVAGESGRIALGGGARINAAAGGAVVIIAPVINNDSGIIKAPDGQVILAAGRSVYLSFGDRDTTASFRGMLVEVSAGDEKALDLTRLIAGSSVGNAGDISADRGNVTLAGLAVNQSGHVSAKTAMLSNGSIYLQARTLGDTLRGDVTLAAGSVTETPLDTADTTTLSQATSFDPYRPVVTLTGKTLDVEGRIASPSGAVSLDARDPANAAKARVYLGSGSSIDASGAWSSASDKSNLLTFKVTSTELKLAPDQQGGLLAGATVTVDLRQGSNVLDLSGYQNNQARTLAQKAAVGGVVSLASSGDIIERSGATVDVSGGGVRYTGATEATTRLTGADGKLYDIGTAPEALRYTSIADRFVDQQARWGYSPVYDNLLMGASFKRPDFTQGAAGGSLAIKPGAAVSGLVLDGRLLGGTTTGSQQATAAPRGGRLVLGTYDSTVLAQKTGLGDVTFQAGPTSALPAGFAPGSALADGRKTQLSLSTDVFATGKADAAGNYVTTGFGALEVDANGRITVPENVNLDGPLGGALTLRANQVEIDGHVNVRGGVVVAQAIETAGTAASPIAASSIVVAQGGGIAATGAWINSASTGLQSPVPTGLVNAPTTDGQPVAPSGALDGGSITLAGPVVDLAPLSTLDVSAGGSVSVKGVASGGAGGAIALAATAQPTATQVPLTLDGALTGYGFGSGGSLSLATSDAVQILRTGAAAAASGLSLGAAFFTEGGFQAYKVTAGKDLTLIDGALLRPRQQSLVFDAPAALALPTGADASAAARFVTLTDDLRKPASLALASSAGTLGVQAGSGIGTDVGASLSLAGSKGLAVNGTLYAPGGSIALADSFSGVSLATPDSALPVIELGAHAIVSTRGSFTPKPNDRGLVVGTLAPGGSVSVVAGNAHVKLDAGSVIDVSGASHAIDLHAVPGAGVPDREVQQASNAGSVSITANDSVVLGGAIRGTADAGAAGGAFSLRLSERGDIADPGTGRRIVVTQSGAAQPADAGFKDTAVAVDKLRGAGFDKLGLAAEDQIVFGDDATLAFQRGVTLDTKIVRVANDANVVIAGAALKLANSYGARTPKPAADPADHSTDLDTTLASPAQPTVAGLGTLRLNADTLDVSGSVTISGTQSTTLAAVHDLRLSGRAVGRPASVAGATLVGALTTAGDLTLSAAQVYPTTGSSFTLAVADGLTGNAVRRGQLTVTHGSGTRGDVLSAGGALTLKADRIAQDGVLEAPLGSLSLKAGSSLSLGATSVTSVSANGLTIPYGETQDGVTWTYGALGSNPVTASLSAPPAKKISLDAPAVDVLAGARVDVSGGGDVAAIEYIPSSAKSVDVLAKGANTYAILPAARLSAAPIDPDIGSTAMSQLGPVYNSIHIGPGGAVPAGDYVLLPGEYALLKGGYLVQLLSGSSYANLQPGQTATLQNGLTVVPGVMTAAGTGVSAGTTLGVVVRQNTDIARLGNYTITNAAYFAKQADAGRTAVPRLPADAGQLSIAATQRLTLNGTLAADLPGANSRSAEVDISAARIALVDQVGRADIGADYLQVDATGLSRLGASLLVGGVRSASSTGEILTPTATDIIVANGDAAPLKAPDLTLAATDSITLRAGSRIVASGKQGGQPVDFSIGGPGAASGAVLRASNGGLAAIARPTTDGARGTITIEAGASVAADGSLALDATRTTQSSGTLQVARGGALALVSGRVSLGETGGVAGLDSGLVLDNAALAGLGDLGTLSIKSYDGITLFGNARVGSAALANLVLDSASFTGQASAGQVATLVAGNVSLLNTSGRDASAGAAGGGTLAVTATRQLTLGAGSKQVAGFGDTRLAALGDGAKAAGEIVAAGSGSLQTASPLELAAARIVSVSGADQAWLAQDGSVAGAGYQAVTISANAAPAPLPESTALGSRLQITGAGIADSGAIVMKSGSIGLQAMTGSVELQSGAVLDAGGASKDFKGALALADAGQVSLGAAHGNVLLAKGSAVNLAAAADGGNAGTLTISGLGTDLSGSLDASAAKGQQGRVALDLATLADPAAGQAAGGFSALNAALAHAGFTEARDIRVRGEDLVVAATDVVRAHHLTLESDGGTVRVAGRLDASAALGGGSVDIAGRSVSVAAGAVIDASATSDAGGPAAAYANGGSVSLVAESGALDFAAGAVLDVRAGAKGSAGSVLLRAPRTPGGAAPLAATLAGQVLSRRQPGDAAASVVVEGNQVYALAPGQAVDVATYAADNIAFMQAVAGQPAGAGLLGDDGAALGHVHVRPAVEVVSAGDLAIGADWDLTGGGWRLPAGVDGALEAGSLVVRAAGNLSLLGASIGNPDPALQSGPTWNIALTSGADLGAASSARTQSARALAAQAAGGQAGAGDLVLDSSNAEASVRTGTGAIRIAAGRDFVIRAGVDPVTGNPAPGVVYTTGVAAVPDHAGTQAESRFTQGGGDVTITAQRDAIGAGNEWMTEWFRAATSDGQGADFQDGAWWTYRPNFHDGVAALGGGNVAIVAGHDIRGLSAWVPTSARQAGAGADAQLLTFGGGDLRVQAGNDLAGGQYMVSRGNGVITAGGRVGTAAASTQLFLMGASGDAALAGATLSVSAGSGVSLSTIDNPSSLFQFGDFSGHPSFNGSDPYTVLSFAANSGVAVAAKSGAIEFGNRPAQNLALDPFNQPSIENLATGVGTALLPPRVAFTAFGGDIDYVGSLDGMTTFPSSSGSISVLAAKSINNLNLRASDQDPAQFAIGKTRVSGAVPIYAQLLAGTDATGGRLTGSDSSAAFINDVVALDGSVVGATLTFPSRARIWAGLDVVNPVLSLQNYGAGDVTEVVADRGSLRVRNPAGWGIDGPGALLLQAGQDVDLGASRGLTSFGNLRNAALPALGADIDVLAGFSGRVELARLDDTYKQLTTAGSLKKPEDAAAAIHAFLAQGQVGPGEIDSFNTSIQSSAGGSINLMAPGGDITVGLPTPNKAKLIGIVTNAGGAIRSFLKGDFNINQGKVLTAQGGDILIYTTDGGIDAGRGAKTSVTTPPPVRTPIPDEHGNIVGYAYSLPVAVAGSGIQTATSKPGGPESVAPKAGDIFLFAPKGTIDAGEAGIASGGAIFIAALTVLNADNISAVGASQGVPVTPPGSVASTVAAAGGSTVTSDSKAGDAAAQAAAAAAAAGVTNFRPAILTVEVMGFGDKNCKETDKDCFAR